MKEHGLTRDEVLVLTASFFYMSCPMIVTPVVTGFAGSLGGGGLVMGLIGGLVNLVSLACRPFAGNLADRVAERRLVQVGAAVMLAGCLGYCFAPTVGLLAAARVLNGVGYACCSVGMSTWLSLLLPPEKIGSGMGLYGTVQALGMTVAPAVGIKLQTLLGYRAVFWVAVGFALVTLLMARQVRDPGVEARTPAAPARLAVVDRKVLPIAGEVLLFTIPYLATQSFLLSYVEKRGLTVDTALFFPLYAAVLVALRAGLRNTFDRVPYRRFLFAGILSSALALVCLDRMTSDLLLAAAAVFMAGGYGIMCSVSQSAAILLAGPGRRGIANSTYYVGIDLGAALGAILGGLLYGSVAIQWFYPCLLVCPVLCVVLYLAVRGKGAFAETG